MEGRRKGGGLEVYKAFKGRRSQITRAERASFGLRKRDMVSGLGAEGVMTPKLERFLRHADMAEWGGVGRAERNVGVRDWEGRVSTPRTTPWEISWCPGWSGFHSK